MKSYARALLAAAVIGLLSDCAEAGHCRHWHGHAPYEVSRGAWSLPTNGGSFPMGRASLRSDAGATRSEVMAAVNRALDELYSKYQVQEPPPMRRQFPKLRLE